MGLLLLAALPRPAAADDARATNLAKRQETLRTMRLLMEAMFGSGDSLGYIADMGRVPSALSDLSAASASPAYSTSGAGGVGMGYGGPYLSRGGSAAANVLDAWGTQIALITTSTTVQLRSAGPDRDASTTADNVLYPMTPRPSHGIVEIAAYSVSSSGDDATLLDSDDVDVTVYYADGGTERTAAAGEVDGAFQAAGQHVGRHYVLVSAKDSSEYEVATAADVVTLRGAKVALALRLVEKAEEAKEKKKKKKKKEKVKKEKVTICHRKGKTPKTKKVSEKAVDSHVKHGDTLGACP